MVDPLTKDQGFTWDHCKAPQSCTYPTCSCNLSVERTSNPLSEAVELLQDMIEDADVIGDHNRIVRPAIWSVDFLSKVKAFIAKHRADETFDVHQLCSVYGPGPNCETCGKPLNAEKTSEAQK